MGKLSAMGRIFYGIVIAGMGLLIIHYKEFPYMLLPPENFVIPGFIMLTFGTLLVLAGTCIVFQIKTSPVSFLLGCILFVIFLFFHIPYEFMVNSNYKHLVEWENAEKELALAGGAFLIAGSFSGKNENPFERIWRRLMPFGAILFSIPIISFGILHFLYAKEASTLVPLWMPGPVFWTYFAGVALIGSGIAIILKIRSGLIAALLGTMIFIWFVIIHIPRMIAAPPTDLSGEIASAFLALAYSGIAFVIAGVAKR